MRQFFKFFFASLLAFIIGIFVVVLLIGGMISAVVSGVGNQKVTIADHAVLKLTLKESVPERTSANPFRNFDVNSMKSHQQPGMNDIIKCIRKAATDSRIKGIYIDASAVESGMAQTEEIRNELIEFRKSGKFVFAYADAYSQKAYYLSSAADKVFVNPQGAIELNGLMTQLLFLKGTFEKLEIEPILIRHGKYKAAGETFVLDKMSDENRNQVASFVNDIWNNMLSQISTSRKVPVETLRAAADSLKIRSASDAVAYKLVDKAIYYDEFIDELNKASGSSQKPETITIGKYTDAVVPEKRKFTSDRIAVIYAEGEITGGEGDEQTIGSDKTAEAIRKARQDDHVKAIVLRVNSPGGSALASEVIWRETILAGKEKPFVVSMSDLAASGGYYISCGAKKVFAQNNTITGSIGVFGLLLNAQNMLKNKLGITTDGYKTGTFTDLGLPTKPMTKSEEMIIQAAVDSIYDVFTSRVSAGRSIKKEMVDSIGQGRVWSGVAALKLNLTDTVGGLQDAINYAAKEANLENYRLKELPEQKDALNEFLESFSGETAAWFEAKQFGAQVEYVRAVKKAAALQGIRMHLGYDILFND